MKIRESNDGFVQSEIKILDAYQYPQKASDEAIYTKLQESKEVYHLIGVQFYSKNEELIHEIIVISEEDDDSSSESESYIDYVLEEARAELSQKFIPSIILTHKLFLELKTL